MKIRFDMYPDENGVIQTTVHVEASSVEEAITIHEEIMEKIYKAEEGKE